MLSGIGGFKHSLSLLLHVVFYMLMAYRPNFDEVSQDLKNIGADIVITEEDARRPDVAKQVKELGPPSQLALNCVGGKSATNIARLLG